MKNIATSRIDYLNSFGNSIEETSIGRVILKIINLRNCDAKEFYYTYNAKSYHPNQKNLFDLNSTSYKIFKSVTAALPYRTVNYLFSTHSYPKIFLICIYILKRIFTRNTNLIVVYNGTPILLSLIKKIVRPKKLIFICHGRDLTVYNGELGKNQILKHCDTIIALNKHVYSTLRSSQHNVYLIPNPISKKALINYEKNPFLFIYVGRIVKNKRIKQLIEQFNGYFSNSPYHLMICGDGEGSYFDKCIQQVKESKVVSYLGYLDLSQLRKLYETASYILLLSEGEGSPLALIDSCGYDIVPIGTRVPGTQDYIEAFGGVLIPEKNMEVHLKKVFDSVDNIQASKFWVEPEERNQAIFKEEYFKERYSSILS